MTDSKNTFEPMHLPATVEHIKGNGQLGRYFLMPGSDGRAQDIAKRLKEVQTFKHRRQHNLYIGRLETARKNLDIGIISSGMGCPSMDIVATELLKLGVKRMIRIGTAGSMQPDRIKVGSLVIPTAAVRDEGTSRHYMSPTVPALSSINFIDASRRAAARLKSTYPYFLGPIHTKDSLYAREFLEGPLAKENHAYMQHLSEAGVLASEMECAQLFTLSQLWNQKIQSQDPKNIPIIYGAVLAIIGDNEPFSSGELVAQTIDHAIDLAYQTVIELSEHEDQAWI